MAEERAGGMTRERAEATTILRGVIGSTAHGLALPGTDDRDEMGVCVEDMAGVVGFSEFEQFIYRSAAEREHRHDAPSQPGDLDLTIYSLRKFCRLALHGNPTILNLLFVPPETCSVYTALGGTLQEMAPLFVSRQAGRRYLGYLEAQRQRLLGERGQKKTNRPELEAKFGFDTKYAMHMLRLGFQGVELLTTGGLVLPMPEPARGFLMGVRRGTVTLQECLTQCGELERELKDLVTSADLPAEGDAARVEQWMCHVYFEMWKARAADAAILAGAR